MDNVAIFFFGNRTSRTFLMVHSKEFKMSTLLSYLVLDVPRTSHSCFRSTLCEERIVDYYDVRREEMRKTNIILKFDKYLEKLFQENSASKYEKGHLKESRKVLKTAWHVVFQRISFKTELTVEVSAFDNW